MTLLTHTPAMRADHHGARALAGLRALGEVRPHEGGVVLDAAVFGRMRRDRFVINVSRGGLVDEVARAAALRDKRIAGAALDVGGLRPPAIEAEASETVEQVRAVLRGEAPNGAVNAEHWTRRRGLG